MKNSIENKRVYEFGNLKSATVKENLMDFINGEYKDRVPYTIPQLATRV